MALRVIDLFSLSKNLKIFLRKKLFLQITMGEMKNAAGENVRNRDYFYTKNSAKMQNNGQGGTENVFNLGIPPSLGRITENSPPTEGGDLPPPHFLDKLLLRGYSFAIPGVVTLSWNKTIFCQKGSLLFYCFPSNQTLLWVGGRIMRKGILTLMRYPSY